MSEHMSPLDAMFLELEQADESAHMHIGAVMIFDAARDGRAPTLGDLRKLLVDRLDALPRFRQRLSTARTGGLHWPTWEPDGNFDIADHVRHATLPKPGGDAELVDWVADFYSHRLDRSRPLWEMVLLDGLEHGRWALASKSHHCLVDGISSVDVGYVLLDVEESPAPAIHGQHPASPPQAADDDEASWWWPPGVVLRGARVGLSAARHPGDVLARARAAIEMLVRDELIPAPSSSLNRPIGGTRRYATVRVPLDELKMIKRELGGTINDVVLALAAGGLRRLLLARGEAPPDGLRGQVPVNIREAGENLTLGNRLTSLYVHLPVAESDPMRRYQRVLHEAKHRKEGTQALGGRTIVDITNLAPPVLHEALAQTLFDVRLFNVTITNVPGPQQTLYAFGSPLREVLPLVPLFASHAVGIAAVSYAGQLIFGLNADRGTVPDLDVLADGIRESLAELEALIPVVADAAPAAHAAAAGPGPG